MVRKKGVPRKSLELGSIVTKTSSTPYLPNFVLQGAMVDTTSNHHNALGNTHERGGHALRSGLEKKGIGEERHFDEEWKPKRKTANYGNNTNDNGMDEDEPPPTSRRETKRDRDGEPKQARPALVTGGKRHPLAEHINLSDLQVIITEALYHYGEPCSFEKLNDFVSNQIKERDIRRKDGTPYAADCRRAIQANLRITSNSLPALYKKDANGMWSMCYTMEEARRVAAASSEHHEFVGERPVKSSLKLVNSRDREATTNNNNAITEKHATRESNNSRGLGLSFESEDQNLFDDDAIQGPRTRAQEKTFKSIVQPNHPNAPYREEDQNPLSLLQKFISLYIICNSEKSSINSMEEEALQYWPKQFHSFARRSIVMCLVNQNPPVFFMRNPEYFTNWQLSESHQWYELSSEEIEKKKPAIYKQLLTAKKSDLTCEDVPHDFSMTLQ